MTPDNILRRAEFSPDRIYRYTLERTWNPNLGTCVFILLNPSTADAEIDDPTIRRGVGFTQDWGYGRCVFVNLFAYRTSCPAVLREADSPIGRQNDKWIKYWANRATVLVAAWGIHGSYRDRDSKVVKLLVGHTIQCLGLTKAWHPKRILYLPKTTELEVYCG